MRRKVKREPTTEIVRYCQHGVEIPVNPKIRSDFDCFMCGRRFRQNQLQEQGYSDHVIRTLT